MATSAQGTQSEEVVEFKCSFCLRKGKVKHSEKFCVECKQQLCSECLQLHNHLHDDHNLLQPARDTSQPVLPSDRCEKHGDKVIEMFCEDHDVVGCGTCAYVDHRLCKTVLNIPSAIQKVFNMENMKQVLNELEQVRINLANQKESRRKQRDLIKQERETSLSKVDEYTETLVAIIRALGKATKISLLKVYSEKNERMQTNERKCKSIEKNVQTCIQQLDYENETHVQLFISMKKGQKLITQANTICKDTDYIVREESDYMVMDKSIENFLTKYETFKTLKQPDLYKIRRKDELNVKIKGDSKDCWIWGSCLLPDKTLLITDRDNKKLKYVDTTSFNIKYHCDLPERPYGVCCMGQHEAAVCLRNQTIQLVSLTNRLTLTRSIKKDFACLGIAYRDKKFYVATDDDSIKVLNKEGCIMQTFCSLDAVSISRFKNVAVHEPEGNIFIAASDSGLICIDPSGHRLFHQKGKWLLNCSAVCTDGRGSVFASGLASNNVVQVTTKGTFVGAVFSASSGLVKPLSLCWDEERSRLYITTATNTIFVLDIDLIYNY